MFQNWQPLIEYTMRFHLGAESGMASVTKVYGALTAQFRTPYTDQNFMNEELDRLIGASVYCVHTLYHLWKLTYRQSFRAWQTKRGMPPMLSNQNVKVGTSSLIKFFTWINCQTYKVFSGCIDYTRSSHMHESITYHTCKPLITASLIKRISMNQ